MADADAACAGEDMSAAANVDALFHRAVVRASGNDLLIEVYDYLGTALTSSLGACPGTRPGPRSTPVCTGGWSTRSRPGTSGARAAAAAIVQLTRDHEAETPRTAEGP
ncbi:FCD domain-containing protein [Streptomyces sp. M19]